MKQQNNTDRNKSNDNISTATEICIENTYTTKNIKDTKHELLSNQLYEQKSNGQILRTENNNYLRKLVLGSISNECISIENSLYKNNIGKGLYKYMCKSSEESM